MDELIEYEYLSVEKLFFKYSYFSFLGMISQGIMTIVEGFIIGRVNSGFALIGLIMPIEYLMLAISGVLSVGISTQISLYYGEKNYKKVNEVYITGMIITLIISSVLMIILFFYADKIALILGTDNILLEKMTLFIKIYAIGYPFCIFGIIIITILKSIEKPKIAGYILSFSSFLSLLILYILVYKLKYIVLGISLYYVLSIGISCIGYFFVYNNELLSLKNIMFDKKIVKDIFVIGIPYLFLQFSIAIFTVVINNLLGKFGINYVIAFSIINAIIIYTLNCIAMSIPSGISPIISYFYSSKKYNKMKKIIKISIFSEILLVGLFCLLVLFYLKSIMIHFTDDKQTLSIIKENIIFILILIPFGYIGNVVSMYFQAIKCIKESIFLSILKYMLLMVPFMIGLYFIFNIKGIFYSFILSDIITFFISIIMIKRRLCLIEKE